MMSKLFIGNLTKSAHIVLPHTTIGQSLNTLSALTFSPNSVLTTIGSCKTSINISKRRATKGVTKESTEPGSSKS